jgi:hypothetical protein
MVVSEGVLYVTLPTTRLFDLDIVYNCCVEFEICPFAGTDTFSQMHLNETRVPALVHSPKFGTYPL